MKRRTVKDADAEIVALKRDLIEARTAALKLTGEVTRLEEAREREAIDLRNRLSIAEKQLDAAKEDADRFEAALTETETKRDEAIEERDMLRATLDNYERVMGLLGVSERDLTRVENSVRPVELLRLSCAPSTTSR